MAADPPRILARVTPKWKGVCGVGWADPRLRSPSPGGVPSSSSPFSATNSSIPSRLDSRSFDQSGVGIPWTVLTYDLFYVRTQRLLSPHRKRDYEVSCSRYLSTELSRGRDLETLQNDICSRFVVFYLRFRHKPQSIECLGAWADGKSSGVWSAGDSVVAAGCRRQCPILSGQRRARAFDARTPKLVGLRLARLACLVDLCLHHT